MNNSQPSSSKVKHNGDSSYNPERQFELILLMHEKNNYVLDPIQVSLDSEGVINKPAEFENGDENFNSTNQEQYSTEQVKEDLSVSYEQQTTQPKEDFARSSENASLEHDSMQHDTTAIVYEYFEFTSVSNVPNDYKEQSQNQVVPHHDSIQNVDQAHFDQVHDQDSIHHKRLHHPEVTDYHEQTIIQDQLLHQSNVQDQMVHHPDISHYQDQHHLQEHITYQEQIDYQVQFHQDSVLNQQAYMHDDQHLEYGETPQISHRVKIKDVKEHINHQSVHRQDQVNYH